MLLENAIKRHAVPDGWVRVKRVRNIPGGWSSAWGSIVVDAERRWRSWAVKCLRVHQIEIADLGRGGIALYDSDHPAVKQYELGGASFGGRIHP